MLLQVPTYNMCHLNEAVTDDCLTETLLTENFVVQRGGEKQLYANIIIAMAIIAFRHAEVDTFLRIAC